MPNGFTAKVRTGRVRPPRLDGGQQQALGEEMVKQQKARWATGVNADGQNAKPLSKKYIFQKKKYRNIRGQPIRDNRMTGVLVKNFALRKAINGNIRAENSTREARAHANRAVQYDNMIGFSGKDTVAILKEANDLYGDALKKAWVPING